MPKKYSMEFQMKEEAVLLWLFQKKAIKSIIISEYDLINLCKVDLKMRSNSYKACINKLNNGLEKDMIDVSFGRVVCVNGDINEKPKYKKKNKKPNLKGTKVFYTDPNFYKTREWRELRVKALVKYGRKCCLCGRGTDDGVILHVDHIKPRSKYPKLELELSNLQILCEDCNLGKSNKYSEDWRNK